MIDPAAITHAGQAHRPARPAAGRGDGGGVHEATVGSAARRQVPRVNDSHHASATPPVAAPAPSGARAHEARGTHGDEVWLNREGERAERRDGFRRRGLDAWAPPRRDETGPVPPKRIAGAPPAQGVGGEGERGQLIDVFC